MMLLHYVPSKHDIQDAFWATLGRFAPGRLELQIESGGCGLLGDTFMTINGLMFCSRHGLRGRPNWKARCLYYDPERGGNAWDYFFTSHFAATTANEREFVVRVPYRPSAHSFAPSHGRSARQVAAEAVRAYAMPQQWLSAYVDALVRQWFDGEPFVGIHIRGTDVRRGFENRKSVSLGDYETALRRILTEGIASKVYLATDEISAINHFKNLLGKDLVTQPCIRSEDGRSVHGHYDGGVPGSPFQKGKEVLVDSLILSRSRHLIRGHSRVTCYSLCLNSQLPFTDLEQEVFGVSRTPWLFN
jgi:hypothetical protein